MRFPSVARACCTVFCTVLTGAAISSEARFYPQPSPKALEVGAEEFREGYMSLRGLEGLYVDVSVVMTAGKDKGIIVPDTLEQQVRDKIESAGLFYLTKEEMQVTPGQPMMNLWPSYKVDGDDDGANNTQDTDKNSAQCDNPVKCKNLVKCESSLWAGFGQSATLLRQPENQYRLSTWGDGDESEHCKDRGNWMAAAVLRKIDFFIADYKKAQQDLAPVVVAKTSDVPEHCSRSWVTHLNVFATNESTINSHIKPIFNRLTQVAERCNTYNYIIETHADQRADSTYNKLLTEARARSIKDYLLSQGMPYDRVKMRPLGESAPITLGSSDADHAKNRRVIIKPVKHDEFQNAELDY